MSDFAMLYCRVDTLLLASCFEEMRSNFIKEFELDPVNGITLPGYAMQAALYHSKFH